VIRQYLTSFSILVCCFLMGCGGPDTPAVVSTDEASKRMVEDYVYFLKQLKDDNKKAPSNKNEFLALEAMAPMSGPAITNGSFIVIWGQGLGTTKDIIAYEKKVETEGGYVLLQDGTVKKMTADEFKSAPKAAKK
jgi:hypothetical protein